jgi:hypothetical protein
MAGGAIRAKAERQAAEFSREAQAAEPEVLVRAVTAGSVAGGLAEEARRRGAAIIMVGSSRRGRFMRVLFGDDTRDILHRTPCSVAVAPRGFAERSSGAITAIGVGYGTDAASQRAGELARWLKPPGGSLRLTQVAHTSIAAEASERPAKLEGFDELNRSSGGWVGEFRSVSGFRAGAGCWGRDYVVRGAVAARSSARAWRSVGWVSLS